jgi:hypothetical protein
LHIRDSDVLDDRPGRRSDVLRLSGRGERGRDAKPTSWPSNPTATCTSTAATAWAG